MTVLFQNVKPGYLTNFNKKDASEVNSLGVTYDFNSIMHYHRSAFSRYAGVDTMKSKEPGIPLGNALELSRLDVLQTNRLYRCGKFCGSSVYVDIVFNASFHIWYVLYNVMYNDIEYSLSANKCHWMCSLQRCSY